MTESCLILYEYRNIDIPVTSLPGDNFIGNLKKYGTVQYSQRRSSRPPKPPIGGRLLRLPQTPQTNLGPQLWGPKLV